MQLRWHEAKFGPFRARFISSRLYRKTLYFDQGDRYGVVAPCLDQPVHGRNGQRFPQYRVLGHGNRIDGKQLWSLAPSELLDIYGTRSWHNEEVSRENCHDDWDEKDSASVQGLRIPARISGMSMQLLVS